LCLEVVWLGFCGERASGGEGVGGGVGGGVAFWGGWGGCRGEGGG